MIIKLHLADWTVRGLGQQLKRDDVGGVVDHFAPTILCLQETKLQGVSSYLASSFLPPNLRTFVFKPSNGASGGIG